MSDPVTKVPSDEDEEELVQQKKIKRKGKKGKGKKKKGAMASQNEESAASSQELAPGEVPEHNEDSPDITQHATFVDNSTKQEPTPRPSAEEEATLQLAEQEEVPFPATVTKSETHKSYTKEGNENIQVTETRVEYETREFVDPRDYGIEYEEEEFEYEPPERDDTLPDLQRLMATLEGELDDKEEPPSLFTRPEHISNYRNITELKLQLEEEELKPYVKEFETDIQDEVLMIGNIELDEVQDEEKRLRDEHIAYQEQEARITREREQEVLVREEEAKKRVAFELKDKRKYIKRMEEIQQQKERLMMDRLHKSFRRSENQLVSTLEERKAEVKTFYGDLTMADGHYGGSKGRRWKVDWDKTPQPIQVKLKCLRGVKDKLPGGRYVMMVSMYNRLGGHVMRWSNLKGQQWGGATLPVPHDGHFYNAEMKVDQSVFTVLPAKPGIRPGMVLVFELFLLRGSVVQTDRVVGWGSFPVADGTFEVIEGKYKCPFLRGEMDFMIDKHEKMEDLMASDLDHWLCNLYFEIVKLPRYLAGQKEYEVELQFSSGILNFPDRVNTLGEEYRDGEAPVPGSLVDVKSIPSLSSDSQMSSEINTRNMLNGDNSSTEGSDRKPPPYDEDFKRSQSPDSISKMDSSIDIRQRRPATTRPMTSTVGSRGVHLEKKVTTALDSDGSDYEESDIYLMKKDDDFYPVKGQPGLFYKRHKNNPVDAYYKKMYTLLPKTPVLQQRRKRRKLTHLEQLEEHTFSLKTSFNEKGRVNQQSWKKVNYVKRQMLSELGLSEWRSREFWGMLIMFILGFFIRIYLHYIGQWLFLQALELPVNKFEFLPYTVNLNYQYTLLHTREEICVVLFGPFFVVLVFVLMIVTSWIMQRFVGTFPDVGSKLIIALGIQAFLDPILILIVDCILQRYLNVGGDVPIADAAKLYWHFWRAEGSGLAGIFITVFLYLFTCFAAGSIVYMYFLRLHNNGRMLDIYWRLHGDEDSFFVPYDLEISNQEMSYICKKSEQWRGEEGERKKTAVYDYIWEEESVEETVWDENGTEKKEVKEGKKEITTHVAIHKMHLDGLREMYRHFLRLPDGAIVEVFGDLSVAGDMDNDVKVALNEGAQKVENLMGSQFSLNKSSRRGLQTAYTNSGFNEDEDDLKKPDLSSMD